MCWGALDCYAAEVVFFTASKYPSQEQRELESASEFYGLNVKYIRCGLQNQTLDLGQALQSSSIVALAIEANALPFVNREKLLRSLRRRPLSVPLLILGLTPEIDDQLLRAWSGGAAVACRRLDHADGLRLVIGRLEGVTLQLTSFESFLPPGDASYFEIKKNSTARPIARIQEHKRGGGFPIFAEITLPETKLFILTRYPFLQASADLSVRAAITAFAGIAPIMLFLKHCAGEHAWHTIHQYANLTIDDPWLRESYGFLDYRRLLTEMERHNFHSTIAFIPWNYDRSQSGTVNLIREHPERFSLCVHGDNHDHKEFTAYYKKPLDTQVAALKQSLARMTSFQAMTGIPYAKIMVFPHSIAPQKTLEALKAYNYLATINASNVPVGQPSPPAIPFLLRPVTLAFGNFPSLRRYEVEIPLPEGFLAMNAFLGNPLLFYSHHDLFASGIEAFDSVADEVNHTEPEIRWCGLDKIARHLYLVRQRADSNYDVLSFSSSIVLENASSRQATFYFQKAENGHPDIVAVNVDGRASPYRINDGHVELALTIPPGHVRNIAIQYRNDFRPALVSIAKDSGRVYLLRMASDFRDIVLSKYTAGREIIRFYYGYRLWSVVAIACTVTLIVIAILRACLRRISTSGKHDTAMQVD
jgi:hypothetical protein